MTERELQEIMAGRDQGVRILDGLLAKIAPELGAVDRNRLAQTIADTLLNHSIKANLKVESPTAVERGEQQEERLQQLLDPSSQEEGGITDLLKKIPVGVSLTIRF